jgi:hypothetical protein
MTRCRPLSVIVLPSGRLPKWTMRRWRDVLPPPVGRRDILELTGLQTIIK